MYLELTGVRKMYDEDNGVKHIDLAVEKGMLMTLLGPSGCGKTTLLNLLGGFLKPDAGSIFLDGQEITSHAPEERPVSTVFQSYALFPHMNVLENVCYGLRFFHRMKKRDAVPVAEKYLDIVGLSEYAKTSVTALSGGQQQRVALARAMATEPKVLLLDEPLSNLDASLRLRMRGELKRLQRKTGMTMIFVTHDQEEALSLSDRIAVMKQGCIVQNGTPEEIYYEPANEEIAAFIGKTNPDFLRPEELCLTEDPAALCTVLERQFMGSHTEYLVTDGEKNWQVSLFGQAGSRFRPGMKVRLDMQENVIEKKYPGLHLDRSGYFFYTQYTLWGYAKRQEKKIMPEAELPGECFFIS